MKAHYELMDEERRSYTTRRDLAAQFPAKYCSLIVDGADQKSYGLPHFVFNTKEDKVHKLKITSVGVLEHGMKKHLSLFVLTEEFESGANHVIEAVHRVLDEKKSRIGRLPEVLFVQADNCIRENKNRFFMAYFEMLVARGVFIEVQVSFLPIGHTHADINQSFSSVASRLRLVDAISLEDLLKELRNCYTPRASAEEMEQVANFSGLCSASHCLVYVERFSQFRYFRFTRKKTPAGVCQRINMQGTTSDVGDMSTEVFRTTCDAKFQASEEWAPLCNSSLRKGFLKLIPRLCDTPATDTTPPDNVLEINKHLRSCEPRMKTIANLTSLEELRNRIYTRRADPFHWDLRSVFEVHGDYKIEQHDALRQDQGLQRHEEQSIENMRYYLNYFLVVKIETNGQEPFWIARTLRISKKDDEGNVSQLKVRWYQAKEGAADAFSAGYQMSTYIKDAKRAFFDDTVDVRAILCEFECLTRSGGLHLRTQKANRQTLNMN